MRLGEVHWADLVPRSGSDQTRRRPSGQLEDGALARREVYGAAAIQRDQASADLYRAAGWQARELRQTVARRRL